MVVGVKKGLGQGAVVEDKVELEVLVSFVGDRVCHMMLIDVILALGNVLVWV